MNYDKIRKEMFRVRKERGWTELDNLKDLAESLVIESAELLEHLLWRKPEKIGELLKNKKKRTQIEDELADVLLNVICFADCAEIDLEKASLCKIKKIEKRYPLHKAKGNNLKYTEFR